MTLKVNGASLRAIRERSGFTSAELARRVGVGQSHLANVEAGRRGVSPALLLKLANELGVPIPAIATSNEAEEQVAS